MDASATARYRVRPIVGTQIVTRGVEVPTAGAATTRSSTPGMRTFQMLLPPIDCRSQALLERHRRFPSNLRPQAARIGADAWGLARAVRLIPYCRKIWSPTGNAQQLDNPTGGYRLARADVHRALNPT